MQSRTLLWIGVGAGVAAVTALAVYAVVHFTADNRRDDPTTVRIQELIDEANSLLKALDDQRHSA